MAPFWRVHRTPNFFFLKCAFLEVNFGP
jgi:steroid 5-alpha reductase family enzyme